MLHRLLFALTMMCSPASAAIVDLFSAGTYSSKILTGNATTNIKTGSGVLHVVVIGNAFSGGELKLFDSTTGTGTLLLDVFAGTPSGGLLSGSGNPAASTTGSIDVAYSTGLTAVTSGSTNNIFIVVYQ